MSIVRISENWSKIVPADSDDTISPCPIVLGEQEAQRTAALDASLREVDFEMKQINKFLDITSDGWTLNEWFESAKERARLIRDEGLAAVSDDPWLKKMTEKIGPLMTVTRTSKESKDPKSCDYTDVLRAALDMPCRYLILAGCLR